jgi:TonB family protein
MTSSSKPQPLQIILCACLLAIILSISVKVVAHPAVVLNGRAFKYGLIDTIFIDTTIYQNVERPPEFPGGGAALIKFLDKNMKYPPLMASREMEGKVTVQFIVERDGSLTNVKAIKGPGRGTAEEAERLIKLAGKWMPGYNKPGQPLRVQYQVPVFFRLKPNDGRNSDGPMKIGSY